MARIINPTQDQIADYLELVSSLPPKYAEELKKFDPWTLYKFKLTGHRVYIQSSDYFNGEVTFRVVVSGEYNLVSHTHFFARVHPDDLEPCDPPLPDEIVGSVLTDDEVEQASNCGEDPDAKLAAIKAVALYKVNHDPKWKDLKDNIIW